jgi:dTDP-4-dehydrorhamnose reductase
MMAQYCSQYGAQLLYYSTDYVFDGSSTTPYLEEDKINPQSVYGSSKAMGEKEAIGNNPSAYILRTAWVYGEYGNNFPKVIAKKLKNKDTISFRHPKYQEPIHRLNI